MKRLLLVTGSRALADFPESQDWAEAVLAGTLGPKDWDVVLTGGCEGSPDAWARELAKTLGLVWVDYRLDGYRYGSDGKTYAWWKEPTRPHPHARNRALVDLCAKQQAAGWTVATLALLAPWSATKGASVTLGMAGSAGLERIVPACPSIVTAKPCSCGKGMRMTSDTWTCPCGRTEARSYA